jgi:hypothetical protein
LIDGDAPACVAALLPRWFKASSQFIEHEDRCRRLQTLMRATHAERVKQAEEMRRLGWSEQSAQRELDLHLLPSHCAPPRTVTEVTVCRDKQKYQQCSGYHYLDWMAVGGAILQTWQEPGVFHSLHLYSLLCLSDSLASSTDVLSPHDASWMNSFVFAARAVDEAQQFQEGRAGHLHVLFSFGDVAIALIQIETH